MDIRDQRVVRQICSSLLLAPIRFMTNRIQRVIIWPIAYFAFSFLRGILEIEKPDGLESTLKTYFERR